MHKKSFQALFNNKLLSLLIIFGITITLATSTVTTSIAKAKNEDPGKNNQTVNAQNNNRNNNQSNNNEKSENKNENNSNGMNNNPENRGRDKKETKQEKQDPKQKKLTEGRLKSCQAKESSLIKRVSQLTKTAENMLLKFSDIAGRVEEFYANKTAARGKTIPDYEELKTDIQTKKTAVQNELTDARLNSENFNCYSDDPKGQLNQFHEDMQSVKNALKELRTSIKNLIDAIHDASNEKE